MDAKLHKNNKKKESVSPLMTTCTLPSASGML